MSQLHDRLLDHHPLLIPLNGAVRPPGREVWIGLAFALVLAVTSQTAFGIIALGAKYVFKDQLQLDPSRIAMLGLLIDIPQYLGFIPGLFRDRWRPFGWGDRLTYLVCSLAAAAFAVAGGLISITTARMVWLLVIYSVMGVMVTAVANGQLATISKRLGLTGRAGTVIAVTPLLLSAAISPLTGFLIQYRGWRDLCLVSAAMSLTGLVMVVWRPKSLMSRIRIEDPTVISDLPIEPLLRSIRRLFSRREVVLAAVIWSLWEFTAGWGTPLFFHFTNDLKLTQSQFELTTTALNLSSAAAAIIYGGLCLWVPARRLLYLGIAIGVAGCVGYAFVTDFRSGVIVSVLVGLTCGIGNTATIDLVLRATPRRLEAVSTMLAFAGVGLIADVSDLIGSVLYQHGGFITALAVTAAVNALDLPLIYLLPKGVFASRERTPVDDRISVSAQPA